MASGFPTRAEVIATQRASHRQMNTTIWDALRILDMPDGARPSIVFHRLFEKFYSEELAKAEAEANNS